MQSFDYPYTFVNAMVTKQRHLISADSNLSESYVGRLRFQSKAIILAWMMPSISFIPQINRHKMPIRSYKGIFCKLLHKILQKCDQKVLEYGFSPKSLYIPSLPRLQRPPPTKVDLIWRISDSSKILALKIKKHPTLRDNITKYLDLPRLTHLVVFKGISKNI